MAISHTLMLHEVFTANGSTWTTTGTLTSVANRLYLGGSGWSGTTLRTFTSLVHNASSNPLTFVKVGDVTYNTVATPIARLVSYRAMKATASNAGTLTLTISGSASRTVIVVSEFDGVDTSGTDGSGAILQTTVSNNADTVNSLNAVLAALGSSNNRCWSIGANNKVTTYTPDGNYTEISDDTPGGSEVYTQDEQWDAGTGDLTCTHTPTTTANHMGVLAHEIKAVAASGDLGTSSATVAFTTAAALTTAISMAASATVAFTTNAVLTTAISMVATATVAFTTAAALTTAISMAASATVVFTTASTLSPSGTGDLGTATATVAFTTTAVLTTAIGMAATSTVAFTTAAVLTTAITFTASATIAFTTFADLTAAAAGGATDPIDRPWQDGGPQWTNFLR